MDINEQLQPVVSSLLDGLKSSIEKELRDQISEEVVKRIATTEIESIVERIITQRLNERIAEFNIESKTKQQLDQTLTQISGQLSSSLTTIANEQISKEVAKKVTQIDFNTIVGGMVEGKINSLVQTGAFGKNSINHTSIDFSGFSLTGDIVKGGIIKNFGSTGIDDRSTQIQMTLMDQAVAFEKAIWTPSAIIKGPLTVEGDLVIKGDIPNDCPVIDKLVLLSVDKIRGDQDLLQIHSDILQKSIADTGLDLNRITQNGKDIVNGNQLGYQITDSNLQRVGLLRDLQTQGEAVLCDTLYVSTRRVGVNTIDPSSTFVVWDEEVEMVMTKRGQDTGYFGTSRHQRIILGADNKDNIILDPDGSVEIENLRVGNVPMSSATAIPNYGAITGTLIWNESPAPGGPVGWVCLGETRWAKFGMIT
jgi:hypothetical protein